MPILQPKKLKLFHYTPRRRLSGKKVQLLLILDLDTTWEWVVSVTPRPCFSPGERTPGTHCTGGWLGPRAGLDTDATRKVLVTLPGIEPRSPGSPFRTQTLYWLSHPVHNNTTYANINTTQILHYVPTPLPMRPPTMQGPTTEMSQERRAECRPTTRT
jgi:hypothetical protein